MWGMYGLVKSRTGGVWGVANLLQSAAGLTLGGCGVALYDATRALTQTTKLERNVSWLGEEYSDGMWR